MFRYGVRLLVHCVSRHETAFEEFKRQLFRVIPKFSLYFFDSSVSSADRRSSKRVFVTGGSGFVGKALIAELVKNGHEVVALARSSSAIQAVESVGAVACSGDMSASSLDTITKSMAECSVVYHLAALVSGSWRDSYEVNVLGTQRIIQCAKSAKIKRFVHCSTEAVLAYSAPLVNVDERQPIKMPPKSYIYARSKAMAEQLVVAANSTGFETVVCRPRMVWGRGDTVILNILCTLARANKFAWIDNGRALTSSCHVRNLCEGLMLAAERGKAGEVYFLTDGRTTSVRTFFEKEFATQGIVFGQNGLKVPASLPFWGPPPLSTEAIVVIGRSVTLNDAKARRELGYVGKVTEEQGLRELQEDYIKLTQTSSSSTLD